MPKSKARAARTEGQSKPTRSGGHKAATRERTSRRALWSGTLSFGLVSIPVELYPATRPAHIGLRMLSPDGTPLQRRFFCPEHEKPVGPDEIARGYEYQRGRYVPVSDEELEGLAPEHSRDISLRQFVQDDTIDPVYFERSYFLMPAGTSTKAYHLLAQVLTDERRAGIATFVLGDRERLAAIFSHDGVLSAELLRFHEEVRSADFLEAEAQPQAAAVKRYKALIDEQAETTFDASILRNTHNEALRALAERKAKAPSAVIKLSSAGADSEDAAPAETVDLMRMLKQSLSAERHRDRT